MYYFTPKWNHVITNKTDFIIHFDEHTMQSYAHSNGDSSHKCTSNKTGSLLKVSQAVICICYNGRIFIPKEKSWWFCLTGRRTSCHRESAKQRVGSNKKTQALLCGAKSHPRALPNHWVSCELMPSHSLLDEWDCLAYTLTRTHLKNPHPSGTNSSMFIDVKPPSYNHTHPSILSQQCNF